MRLLLTSSVFFFVAPIAHAQDAEALIGGLTANVHCSGGNAADDIKYNIKKQGASEEALAAALSQVAADESRCVALRDAARELSSGYIVVPPVSEEDLNATASRAVVDQALADAASRSASLKFDVGPPPRNVTRERGVNP